MSVQGNVESRLKEFVHHPEVKRVCIEEHALPCKLGVQASTDFRIAGAFTKSQFQMVRSIGVEMANEEQINAEMEARQVELEHKQVMLEVKIKDPTSDKHIVSKVNISIFFHVFVFVLFLVVSLFEKKKKLKRRTRPSQWPNHLKKLWRNFWKRRERWSGATFLDFISTVQSIQIFSEKSKPFNNCLI